MGSDKLYFKIGEVSRIVGVPAYVLRYWESEFPSLRPQKSRSQQRVYRRRDVEALLKIKHLLYTQRFTIAGARQQLKDAGGEVPLAAPSGAYIARQSLEKIRVTLRELQALVRTQVDGDRGADPSAYLKARATDAVEQPLLERER
ncbi:MAG: MerR family transcriptional regulator [Nannocystaceae bacterium]